ncbi:MAG TPA: hypothetical protein VIV11_36090 [Kofleriaceae bacterium]
MTKKGPGSRDHRSEPDSEGSGQNFRVDRVFAPTRPSRPTPSPHTASRPAATKPPTIPPPLGTSPPPTAGASDSETELSLRRQLSRLQRQLADAQRELANKDDEVAAVVEKRLEIQQAYDVILEEHRQTRLLVDEAIADRTRTTGIQQRLQEAVAAADELRHQLERERTERATMAVQFDEAQAAFEKARNLWRDETAMIDEQHITQIAQLEQQKKVAVEAAEHAMKTSTERQYQAHEAELEALRAAHERSLAALRGELAPKVAEARNLAAEIERLRSEVQAQAAEHRNLMTERIELHTWEMQQQLEAHSAEMATLARNHAAEITQLNEEVHAANQAGQLIERNSTLREQLWEQTVTSLRDSQKKLQQEVADARERAAQAEASKWSVETRLVGTLQALEKTNEQIRDLRERLDAEEVESRRNALDRQRFAAYLEEGLAMLGALPGLEDDDARGAYTLAGAPPPPPELVELDAPTLVPGQTLAGAPPPPPDDLVVDLDVPSLRTLAGAPPPPPDAFGDESNRPTRSYAVAEIDDGEPDLDGAADPHRRETVSGHDDPEADPLPEPTRP